MSYTAKRVSTCNSEIKIEKTLYLPLTRTNRNKRWWGLGKAATFGLQF
ncbi:hypothetical protein MGSAQ_001642, partial [marine sediment metagenome]